VLILKTPSVGFLLWFGGTIVFLLWEMAPSKPGKAIGISALRAVTLQNPLYWVGVIVMFAASFAFFRFTR
jgi:hypothetical protein